MPGGSRRGQVRDRCASLVRPYNATFSTGKQLSPCAHQEALPGKPTHT